MIRKLVISGMIIGLMIAGWISAAPIHDAAKQGNLVEVRKLIATDEDVVNEQDDQGNTPLHYAAEEGHNLLVILLLEKGADRTIKNNKGKTPHDLAKTGAIKDLLLKKQPVSGKSPIIGCF